MEKTTRWTCMGGVRGNCGCLHRSLGTAVACCKKDMHDVARGKGIATRKVTGAFNKERSK